jgi:hypothetical protein
LSLRTAVIALLVTLPVGAEFSADDWKHLRSEADALVAKAGEVARKRTLIQDVSEEDSARVARLLVDLAAASQTRREKLTPRLEKAANDFLKVRRQLRRKHGTRTPRRELEKDKRWQSCEAAVKRLTADVETADRVLADIDQAIGRIRSAEAVRVLVDLSDTSVVAARQSIEVRNGILRALWHQPVEQVVDHVLIFAADEKLPQARARVLGWIGTRKVVKGYEVALESLRGRESAVVRSAVAALQTLDDPRCVPALIQARRKADGLVAEEIELALHHFTGETFFGAGADAMWSGWWRSKGQAWLDSAATERHEAVDPERKGGAAFYGIETRSNRIVFVLDRSGSMKRPVPQKAVVTGKAKDRVPGKTRLEVAKNQLMRTVRGLPRSAKFAVVFYSHDVHTWRDPPSLMPATAANKKDAMDWFREKRAVGSTMIFDALRTALLYAGVGGGGSTTDPKGADTIFLLSDGAPSTKDGNELLTGAALEEAVRAFLEANRAFRCVVHTIGVGPQHNRELMQRLARETGGTYKAVGMG